MSLALFDLDNTLLAGDSDFLWGQFLATQGLVDGAAHAAENQRFYDDYREGRLDIHAYLQFALRFLANRERGELDRLHQAFMESVIRPIIAPGSTELLTRHRQRGDLLVIITATNRFITAPIAAALGVEHLIATEAEVDGTGRFTGQPHDVPCFQRGKVIRLQRWLAEHAATLAGSWFYSDSHNDLPLLELVDHPVVVDPDPILADTAEKRGWPTISLR